MLEEKPLFRRVKATCDARWEQLDLADPTDLETIRCPGCGSPLPEPSDPQSDDPARIGAKRRACGATLGEPAVLEALPVAVYRAEDHIAPEDGGAPVPNACPACNAATHVHQPPVFSRCFNCGHETTGDCWRCGTSLEPQDLPWDGTTKIRGSFGEAHATRVALATVLWRQTMAARAPGDSLECQGTSDRAHRQECRIANRGARSLECAMGGTLR